MAAPVALVALVALAAPLFGGCWTDEAGYEQLEREAVVCPVGPQVPGIDVSYWQPNIDWNRVAADGIVFAFLRVSDGDPATGGVYDTEFQANWTGTQAVGIIRGPYQYFRPSDDPIAQADLVISEIGGAMTPGDLPPVIDVEATDGRTPAQVATAVGEWINRIETELGVTPIIYTGKYFWQDNVQSDAFASYPLWHAAYPGNWTPSSCPNIADQWSGWAFWQYSSSGNVDGIGTSTTNVDVNVFNGDLAGLQALTFGDPVCGDGYCVGGEDHDNCPEDCPIFEPVPPLGRIVDDSDLCFEKLGTPAWWHPETAGYENSLYWTYCVDAGADTVGVWHLTFDEAGEYRVEAYTDGDWAESQQATYQVRHGGDTTPTEVDQSQTDGWTFVGEFQFATGGDQWVRLEDLTGEPYADRVMIVFDALRLTRLDPDPDGGVAEPDAGAGADAGVSVDASGDATDNDGNGAGCGCRSGATGTGSGSGSEAPAGLVLVLVLALLLGPRLARRRRRT
jgi:GH25 family lysozyme M1 (1,4-beta-N-acetylmuramidase)